MTTELARDDVVAALAYGWPGVEWSYDGDGSSLDPVYGDQPVDENGDPDGDPPLLSRGLEWPADTPRPTLAAIGKQVADATVARDRAAKLVEIAAAYQAAGVAVLTDNGKAYLAELEKLYAVAATASDPAAIELPLRKI